MRDPRKLEDKLESIGNIGKSILGDKRQAVWYWFIGVGVVIPILTYVSVSLMSLMLGVVLSVLGASDAYLTPIMLALTAACCATSVFAYYKLWIIYKGKNGNSQKTT